jgi:hypothetical protein
MSAFPLAYVKKVTSEHIQIITILVALFDIAVFLCAFTTVGEFQTLLKHGIFNDFDFELGEGWKTFLAGGLMAFVSCAQLISMFFILIDVKW